MGMMQEFKNFAIKGNVVDLAVGIIIGAAFGKIVGSAVDDLIMPLIGMVMPAGNWKELQIVLKTTIDPKTHTEVVTAIQYGHFLGTVVDFILIALVVFLVVKALLEPAPEAPAPPSKECPECKETIAEGATKCKFCCSAV